MSNGVIFGQAPNAGCIIYIEEQDKWEQIAVSDLNGYFEASVIKGISNFGCYNPVTATSVIEQVFVSPIPVQINFQNNYSVKKAVVVGINKYSQSTINLSGCVNDALNFYDLLCKHYDFKEENIRLLTDTQATKDNIIKNLKWLIEDAKENDTLVFYFAGHGSQVKDLNNDEEDRLDEILIPYDICWNDPLSDDILSEILKQLPQDNHFCMIYDACHSGTMDRNIMRSRSIQPPSEYCPNTTKAARVKAINDTRSYLIFSACKDNQTASEQCTDNICNGVFTKNLVSILKQNPNITWKDLQSKVIKAIHDDGYKQTPQLNGLLVDKSVFSRDMGIR